MLARGAQFFIPENLFYFADRPAVFDAEGPVMQNRPALYGIVAYRFVFADVKAAVSVAAAVFKFFCFPDQYSALFGFFDFRPAGLFKVSNRSLNSSVNITYQFKEIQNGRSVDGAGQYSVFQNVGFFTIDVGIEIAKQI